MSTSEISGAVTETVVMGGDTYSENLSIDMGATVTPTTGEGIDTVSSVDPSEVFLNNQGTVTGGSGADGANFAYGISQLTNEFGAHINGGVATSGTGGDGVEITLATDGYGTNAGFIAGGAGTTGGDGLDLKAGATFYNGFSGTITGGNGTATGGSGVIVDGGSIENENSISGGMGTTTGGDGVVLNGGYLSDYGGIISGGDGPNNSLGAGVLLNDGGTVVAEAEIDGGIVPGVPAPAIVHGARAQVAPDATSYGYSVQFGTGGGTLDVSAGSAVFNGDIGGFTAGDTINFYGASNVNVASYSSTSATISYSFTTSSDGTETQTLTLAGDYSGGQLSANDGTVTACYVRGTRIRTPQGDQPIESLAIGATVLSASGEARRVRWLGHRTVHCSTHPEPARVWPVRIAAHAFANNIPARDLWMSPGHSVLVEDSLIQACNLVNDVTVQQIPQDRVEYWHLELDSHDVIMAEGLPAETYLDTGNRTAFENGGAFLELHPTFEPRHWTETCYPLALDGAKVTRARERLLNRITDLGYCIVEEADTHLQVDGRRIEPTKLSDSRLAFVLPEHAMSIELCSRAFVPAHIHADSRDGRVLGVCVRRLQLDGCDIALDDESFFDRQWHQLESFSDGWRQRWTREGTQLPSGTRLVVIDLGGRGYYRVPSAAPMAAVRTRCSAAHAAGTRRAQSSRAVR